MSAPNAAGHPMRAAGLPSTASSNLNRSAATSTASLASTSTASSSVPSVVSTGLRRSPSTTDVLNPNSDSFKVGDRIYVNGTKPGTIRFLGPTSFAPGQWSGVELDDEGGKNDGAVNGVRYFECENKQGLFGLFVRPYRLTSEPLPSESRMSGVVTPTSDRSSSDQSQQQRAEPPAKVQKSNSGSTVCGNLRVGARVVVNASSGLKVGTLRYLGPTDFAAGAWAGIELDVAVGKNDGSVAGKRYFNCQMNYGLFAPVNKVSKDTAWPNPQAAAEAKSKASKLAHTSSSSSVNRMLTRPSSNLSSIGGPTSGLRRGTGASGSQESLCSVTSTASVASRSSRIRLGITSLASPQKTNVKKANGGSSAATASAASSALATALTEKEEHISQLLKERDLERGEVARAAARVEELEERLALNNEESQRCLREKEEQLEAMRQSLAEGSEIRQALLDQIEDERRKLEILEFRTEEEMVGRMELKDELERMSAQAATMQPHKEDDREEEMYQLQEDLVKKDDKIFQLEKKLETRISELASLQPRLKELENQAKLNEERNKRYLESIDELNRKLKRQEDTGRRQLEELAIKDEERKKLRDQVDELLSKSGDSSGQLSKLTEQLRDRDMEMDKLRVNIAKYAKEAEDHRSSGKRSEEELREQLKQKEREVEELTRAEKQLRGDLEKKDLDVKKLERNIDEMMKCSGDNSQQLVEVTQEVRKAQAEAKKFEDEVIKLRNQIDQMDKQSEERIVDIESLRKIIKERDEAIAEQKSKEKKLEESLNCIEEELIKSGKQIAVDLQRKDDDVKKLQKRVDELLQASGDSGIQLTKMNEEIKERQRENDKLEEELRKSRDAVSKLEREKAGVINNLDELKRVAQSKDDTIDISEHRILELEDNLRKKSEEVRKLELHLEDTIRRGDESSHHLDKLNEENREKQAAIKKLKENVKELKDQAAKDEQIRIKLSQDLSDARKNFSDRDTKLEQLIRRHSEAESDYLRQINSLKEEKIELEVEREKLSRELRTNICGLDDRDETIRKLREQLEVTRREFDDYRRTLEGELNKTRVDGDLLDDLRRDIYRVQEENGQLRETNDEMKAKMERIVDEMEIVQKRHGEVLNEFEAECHRLEGKLEEKSRLVLEKEQQIYSMESENELTIDTWRQRIDQEKTMLMKKIEDLESALNNGNNRINSVSSTTKTSVAISARSTSTSLTSTTTSAVSAPEDREQYESQIEFLNSVIVDMQKKNDELKSKIQVLEEMGDADFNETADSLLKGVNGGRRAPRLFCDICDCFDLHDTEDCPQQSGQMEDLNGHSKHNGVRGQDRAYCASCEVFGHWTQDCQDNESF